MKGKVIRLTIGIVILVLFFAIDFIGGQQILLKDKTEKLRRKFEKDRSTIEAQSRGKKQSKKKPHFIDSVGTNIDSKILAAKNSEHIASSTSSVNRNVKVESNSDTPRNVETNISSDDKASERTSSISHYINNDGNSDIARNSSDNKNETVETNIASGVNYSDSEIKTTTALHAEIVNGPMLIDGDIDIGIILDFKKDGPELPLESSFWVTRLIKIIISVIVTVGLSILSLNYMRPFSFYVKDDHLNEVSLSVFPRVVNNDQRDDLSLSASPTSVESIDSCILMKDTAEEIEYADKNLDILMKQLKDANLEPLTFIPLDKIRRELDSIFVKVNKGESTIHEDKRMDYLLKCMEINPEYVQEQECERIKFRQKISEMKEKCLHEMRGFIPSSIFFKTKSELIADGLSLAFVKRVMSKKCLWLIRLDANAISKLHIAELQSKYAILGHSLDLVELVAVYSALPYKFMNDFDGKKSRWFDSIESAVRETLDLHEAGRLSKDKQRHSVYNGLARIFSSDISLHHFDFHVEATNENQNYQCESLVPIKSAPNVSNESSTNIILTGKSYKLCEETDEILNNLAESRLSIKPNGDVGGESSVAVSQAGIALNRSSSSSSIAAPAKAGGCVGLSLMDQLKGGIKLKKASEAPPIEKPLSKSNAQNDIMKGILQGASRLRKVIVPAGDEKK